MFISKHPPAVRFQQRHDSSDYIFVRESLSGIWESHHEIYPREKPLGLVSYFPPPTFPFPFDPVPPSHGFESFNRNHQITTYPCHSTNSHTINSAGRSGWFCNEVVDCPQQLDWPRGLGSMGGPSVPVLPRVGFLGLALSSLASLPRVGFLGHAVSSLTCCRGGFHDALQSITATTTTRLPLRK